MQALNPYLLFDGNCAQALRFYQHTLGGELEAMMTYADAPDTADCENFAPGTSERIMHARLVLHGGAVLMASDCPVGYPYDGMKGFHLSLTYATVAQAQHVFAALAENGNAIMPLQKTFWAEVFGMVVDRFGAPWMIAGDVVQG
ncbi:MULTISPECIES: VOC family protein [Paraburkholderia]|uniref:VOC family protein n=1 Tax=Paraburkholderia TaxID=1822464 RepID=UPI000ABA8C42|nr:MULTISPECIES: VOC family protein [Paraburkholderia]WEY41728.1 VOC family protein [Paraburkholderia sp. SUR17]